MGSPKELTFTVLSYGGHQLTSFENLCRQSHCPIRAHCPNRPHQQLGKTNVGHYSTIGDRGSPYTQPHSSFDTEEGESESSILSDAALSSSYTSRPGFSGFVSY